jgi:predicted transcriptional regulator
MNQSLLPVAGRAIGRFRRQSGGSVVTEYSLFAGLLLAAALLGSAMIGDAAKHALQSVFPDNNSPSVAGRTPSSDSTGGGPSEIVTPGDATLSLWKPATIVVFVAGGTLLWWKLFGRRKDKKHAEEEAPPASTEEAPESHLSAAQRKLFSKRQRILHALADQMLPLHDGNMTIRQLMSDALTTVAPETRHEELEALMAEKGYRHLLVTGAKDELLGIISDRDVRGATCGTATDLMTADPLTVSPDSLVKPAITLMLKKRISALPVVDEGRLVGMFTTTDIAMALQCALQLLQTTATAIERDSLRALEREPHADAQERLAALVGQ